MKKRRKGRESRGNDRGIVRTNKKKVKKNKGNAFAVTRVFTRVGIPPLITNSRNHVASLLVAADTPGILDMQGQNRWVDESIPLLGEIGCPSSGRWDRLPLFADVPPGAGLLAPS